MLGFDSLTSVTKGNILSNASLHTVPPISGHEIVVHLIPSGKNGISRLMCFTKYLILSLYHNIPSSSSEKLGDFSSLMLCFIS
jgi:hypothetical protein